MIARTLMIALLAAAPAAFAQLPPADTPSRPRSSAAQFLPTGELAEAQAGATIREKPAPDGPMGLVLGGGGPVELISRVENGSGAWWYIRSEGLYGWIDERELQRKP